MTETFLIQIESGHDTRFRYVGEELTFWMAAYLEHELKCITTGQLPVVTVRKFQNPVTVESK